MNPQPIRMNNPAYTDAFVTQEYSQWDGKSFFIPLSLRRH